MLDEVFNALGLGEKEVRVYLALLERGSLNAGDLAKYLNQPRSSIYGFLKALATKGLVSQGDRGGAKLWYAESPDTILDLVNQHITEWETVKITANDLIPALKSQEDIDYVKPTFQYFEGAEGMRRMLSEMLLYRDIETFAFWPISDMLDVLGSRFHTQLNVQRIRQNISIRGIWPPRKVVDIAQNPFLGVGEKFLRELRRAPDEIDSSMGYWAFKNRVVFVASRRELFGYSVESVELFQMLKTQFDCIWNISKRIEVPPEKTESFFENFR